MQIQPPFFGAWLRCLTALQPVIYRQDTRAVACGGRVLWNRACSYFRPSAMYRGDGVRFGDLTISRFGCSQPWYCVCFSINWRETRYYLPPCVSRFSPTSFGSFFSRTASLVGMRLRTHNATRMIFRDYHTVLSRRFVLRIRVYFNVRASCF